MALANVISLQSGTNFIINVAAAQLSSDVTEKDFTVLHNGTAVANVSYNKTTPTTLQYVGASLPSTTIEIRRKTSFDQAKNLVTYANRFSSSKWNESLLRIQRWEEEVDLNGAGATGAGVIPIPANDAYGAVWTNDTIYSPTRKAVWDKVETLSPKASPTFTGVPAVPTAAFATNTTQIASTAFVKNVLGNAPTITNPAVSNGSFTSPSITTPAINGGTAASIALSSSTTDTPALTDNTTRIINALFHNNVHAVTGNSFKIPPNILIQYGSTVVSTNSGGDFTVNYPTTFINTLCVIPVNGDRGVTSSTLSLYFPLNTTGFSGSTTPSVVSGAIRVNWIAIGTY